MEKRTVKIAHTADLHFGSLAGDLRLGTSGVYRRVEIAFEILEEIISYANQNCQVMVIAGDVFDTHNPSTRLLFEFNKRIQTTKIPIIIVLGQHDQPRSIRGHTSFPWTYDKGLIFIADTPRIINIGGWEFVCISYSRQILMDDNWQHLNQYLKQNSKAESIIVMHFPFAGAKISDKFTMRAGLSKQVFDDVEFKKALMGDIHTPQILSEEQKVFYPGSPVYVSRAEPNDKGFFIHDLTENTHEFIKLNPEPLPVLPKIISKKIEKRAATNKIIIKDLLQEHFAERADKMINILEEIGMGGVLNNSVYTTGQDNAAQ